MKKYITHIALFSLVAAALVAVPATSRAEDKPKTDAPPAAKKAHAQFRGKVTAIDTAAMTLTVDTQVIYVTSETKITKGGKPATLSEITVGETATGSCKKDDAGKMDATTIHAGEAAPHKERKKATDKATDKGMDAAPETPPAPTK